ncbi:MAG TPA: monovalent cation:proton antiporter-2 (CPA2) family protein [Xanthomonadaceae bacterium]|jgi:glutathione-regulated potassium-efflux system protein KefB
MHGNGYLEIVLVFLLAAVIAVPLFRKLGLGAVLGYLAAGVALGPQGMQLVRDPARILGASEFGVVMLLFIIGLELSPARLWVMRRRVFGVGGLQVILTAAAFAGLLIAYGIAGKAAVVVGIGLALSSTAVGLQLLAERKELTTDFGRLSFAILLFQDLAAIPLLVAIPLLGDARAVHAMPMWQSALQALGVIAGVVIGGRLLLRQVFRVVAATQMPEVFTATSLLVVAGTAWLMQLAGLSMGLGAFIAGVLLADSEFRHELESQIEPFKGLLLGLFFMAVGMSLDLRLVAHEPLMIAAGVAILLAVKGVLLFALGRLGKLRGRSALMLAAALALGGEFAFVVFGEALKAGLIDATLRDELVVIVGLSMAVTPLLVIAASNWLQAHPEAKNKRPFDVIDNENPRVIIAGFGRVGQIVGRVLLAQKISFTALENSAEQVDFMRRFGNQIYFGDPAKAELLRAAHAERAEVFVVATDDPDANVRTARLVKRLFPHLKVYARARNRQHAFKLMDLNVDQVVRETLQGSLELTRHVLEGLGFSPEVAAARVDRFRAHDEKVLAEQYLVYDDEGALLQSAQDARRELQQLFEADTESGESA